MLLAFEHVWPDTGRTVGQGKLEVHSHTKWVDLVEQTETGWRYISTLPLDQYTGPIHETHVRTPNQDFS